MTPDIQNRKEMSSTAIPSAFQEECPVNFGPQTKKFYWLTLSHPSGFFGGDYISALRGCCPLNFLYALEIDQALIAHTQMGMGVPQKTFDRENLKFGLKFSALVPITSGLVGISSPNFSRPRDELWSRY